MITPGPEPEDPAFMVLRQAKHAQRPKGPGTTGRFSHPAELGPFG